MAIIFAIGGFSQGEITIGNGTATTAYVPMHCNYDYSYTQTIYTSSEIVGGTISQIAYYMTSTDARIENIVIYAGNSTKSVFASNTDYEPLANLTQVFSGTVTFNQGWNYITLTTPFLYNGIDNLLIAIDKNTGNYASRSWQSHSSSFASCLYYYQDDNDIDPSAPAASNKGFGSSRPNTKFVITPTDPGFCFAPTSLTYSNVLTNEVTISWDANIDVASYLIEYKTSSQEWADATLIPGISGNTHVITNLNANTQYNIRVSPECTSFLPSIITLRTGCGIITQFPWIEGFEDAFNPVSVAPGNKPAPYCWYIIDSLNTGTYFWKTSSTARSGSKSIYFEGYGSATTTTATYQNNDWLISPIISLTGNERLNFWSKKSSSSYKPDLLIYAMDVSQGDLNPTASNANFVYLGEIDTNILSTTYSEYEFSLSSLVGDYRLAFVRKKIANGSVYIDDVKVSAIPTCFPPTEIAISNILTDQAELNFIAASPTDVSWNVMLKNLSTNITETEQIFSLPHTFYNLTPNTNYSFSIMTDCGDGTFSDVTLPITFRTNCVPVAVPFIENFSTSVVTEPTCWSRMSGLLTDTATLTTITTGWNHTNYLDTAMYLNIWGTSVRYWLISPTIDLGDGSIPYQVEFDAVLTKYSSGAPNAVPTYDNDDKFAVGVSLDNGLTWLKTNATIWADGDVDTERNYSNFGLTPSHVVVKLMDASLVPYSGLIKIGLYGESTISGADNNMYIDNFSINEIPNCPAVYNTTASVENFSSIKVNFATDNAEDGIGWDIAYDETDPNSFDPNTANIISVNDATELPYIITGLNAGSTYSVSVRQNCGGEWSSTISVSIPDMENVVTLPYIQNFEDLNNVAEWTLSNPDSNKWFIGSTVPSPDETGNTLFVGKQSTSNEYAHSAGYSYAHTLLEFGDASEFMLSFDWKSGGESTYDFTNVYLLPISDVVPATGFPTNGEIVNRINLQSSWQNINLILDGEEYSNTAKRLLFVWRNDASSGTQPAISIDNISVIPMTCSHPSNLSFDASSITQTSVELSWTENEMATSWIVEYSTDGLTWMSETATTNTNFVLSGLNHSTPYKVRVKSVCNESEFSAYSNRVSFTTECGTINIPYVQNFDNDGTGSPILPICWSRLSNQSTSTLYPYISTTNQSGGGSLYFYADSAKYNIGILPEIDASVALNSLQLTFYYRKGSAASNLIIGAMSDPSDITTFDSITTVTASATSVWELKEVNLDSYQGAGTYIAFKNSGSAAMTSYIDGLNVDIIPSCNNTYSLTSVSSGFDKAILNWHALTYDGQGYEISYSPVATGFDPNAGTIVSVADNTTITPYELTGLTPSTTYSIAVRQACGGAWSNIITITTIASPAQIPYTCDFEDETERSSWLLSNTTTANKWVIDTAVNSGLITGNSLYVSNDNGATNAYSHSLNTIVASRLIEFDGSDAYSLTFNSRVGGEGTTTMYDFFKVYLVDEDTNYVGVASTPYYSTSSYSQGALLINGNPYFNNPSNSNNINNHYIEIPSQGETGTIKRLVFVWRNDGGGGTQPPVSIDNISITPLTCPAPIITLSNVSQNDITLSWTPATNDVGWTIFYKEASSTDYDSSNYTTTPPPFILSNLTANTAYNIYIKSDCGGSNSDASNIIITRTLCDAITTLPYTENFDTYGTTLGTFPTCWQRPVIYSNYPSIVSAQSVSSPASLRFQSLTTNPTYAISPQLDVDINTLQLSFKIRKEGLNSGKIIVGVMSNPTDTSTFEPVMTFETMEEDIWIYNEVNFDNTILTGYNNHIAFKHVSLANNYFYWIDDVSIHEIPTCIRPTELTAIDGNDSDIEVSFTPGTSTDNAWIVYYKPTNETTWDSISTTQTPVTLTNLQYNTAYQIYVKTDCGVEQSFASETITHTTICNPSTITTFPWTDGFEAGVACWKQIQVSGTTSWTTSTTSSNVHSGLNSAYFTWTTGAITKLITPTLDISSLNEPYLSFWHKQVEYEYDDDYDIYYNQDSLKVYYRADTNSSTPWIQLLNFNNEISSFRKDSVALPNPSATYQIAFEGYGGDGLGIYLDDVEVYDNNPGVVIPCSDPTSITSVPSNTTATLSWTPGGSEASWEVRLGESGTVQTANSNTNFQLSGLTANTNYTVYVRANCGGTYSNWISYTFTTLANTPATVVTSPATLVAQTTATLNGTITAGTEAITAQGFEWKEVSATDWTTVNAAGTTISHNLTGLTASTAYEFKAFATTASGTVYGTPENFTTLAQGITPPTVVTVAADQIAQTTATLNGTITAGTEAITAQGFEWKETSATDWTIISVAGTTISHNLTGLTANTAYEFKAFATTASGTVYGTTENFTTLAIVAPVVTTDSIANLEGRIVTLYGTITLGTETLTAQGFEWKEASATDWTNVDGILTGNVLSYELTDLTPNTAYNFRAYATTASGTVTGTTINFSTLGLNEVQGSEMSIMMYPNPTSNQTNLIVNGVSGDAKIIISDMQGRILNTTNVKSSNGVIEHKIDVSNFAKGVYYIRIQNNQLSKTQKLIVK